MSEWWIFNGIRVVGIGCGVFLAVVAIAIGADKPQKDWFTTEPPTREKESASVPKRPRTHRAEIAVMRAEKALAIATSARDLALVAVAEAEADLVEVQRDLDINRELDARPAGYNQVA